MHRQVLLEAVVELGRSAVAFWQRRQCSQKRTRAGRRRLALSLNLVGFFSRLHRADAAAADEGSFEAFKNWNNKGRWCENEREPAEPERKVS